MSPILFSLFVDDLELFLQSDADSGLHFEDLILIILLFADDMALLAKTPTELQTQLNRLYDYCNTWGLKVNTSKTKIMVFRRRGKLNSNDTWSYNGELLETIDSFNYLGIIFNYTGKFNMNREHLCGKALKALNVFINYCKKFDLKPSILFQLFDSFVGSIVSYACEIWGIAKAPEIERIHLKFCKYILKVNKSTPNIAVYGELGRYPLYINRFVRIIKYWLKVKYSENIFIKTMCEQS